MPRPFAGRAALVVAHPGHELRVYGWLEQARPLVFVLTDGSGGSGVPRLASTVRLLEQTGAEPGDVIGRLSDRDLYDAILTHDHALFAALAAELAGAFVRSRVRFVAGDATDGYHPAHDACRLVTDAAVTIAQGQRGRPITNFAFPITGRPDAAPRDCRPDSLGLLLDDGAFDRKRATAEAYPEMLAEIDAAVAEFGWDAFRREVFFPVEHPAGTVAPAEPPYYEWYGAEQVRAGRYREVLRHDDHFRPLCRAVWAYVNGRPGCRVPAAGPL
jgi:hypothetical protein